ncbi:MAG: VWA domain-containing protein, partial [Acidobacteria bacterium]|nr:VWA domain-containing protein [Acidobacteriota bacterium]
MTAETNAGKSDGAARKRARRVFALLLFYACAALVVSVPPASTQDHTRPRNASPRRDAQPVDDEEVVTISTNEVLLPVTVRDAGGHLVTDLARKDFRVIEDGREQSLNDLALRQVPVDVALLIDSSSSVASSLEDFRRAVEQFASRLAPEDRVSLIKFDDRVELLLDWTQSRLQLRRALRRITPGVFTRFNDALLLAAHDQFQKGQRRHALVVLSDGIDSGRGATTLEAALRSLLEAQVSVYVIS